MLRLAGKAHGSRCRFLWHSFRSCSTSRAFDSTHSHGEIIQNKKQNNANNKEVRTFFPGQPKDGRFTHLPELQTLAEESTDKLHSKMSSLVAEGALIAPKCFTFFLDHLVESKRSSEALQFLSYLFQRHGNNHYCINYNRFVATMIENKQIDATETFLRAPSTPTMEWFVYQRLSNYYTSKKRFLSVFETAQLCHKKQCDIPVEVYGKWISTLCKSQLYPRQALLLLDQLIADGKKPDLFSVSQIINELAREKIYNEVLRCFKILKHFHIKPSVVLFTGLIHHMLQQNNIKYMEATMSMMVSFGITPNAVTYTSIIQYLLKNDQRGAALDWFQHMKQQAVEPDQRAYHSLLYLHASHGEINEMNNVMHEMNELNIIKDSTTYSILIKGFMVRYHASNDDLYIQHVRHIIKDMKENSVVLTAAISHQLLTLFLSLEDSVSVTEIIRGMDSSPGSYNTITMNSILEWYNKSLPEKTKPFIQQMKENNVARDATTYKHLLDCVIDIHDILQLVEEAKNEDLLDSFVFTKSLARLAACGYTEKATYLLMECKSNYNMEPNNQMYCVVLDQFLKEKNLSQAEHFFSLLKSNITPDTIAYNCMLFGLVRMGELSNALLYWQELQSKDLLPDTQTFNALIEGHIREGKMDDALQFWDSLHANGLNSDFFSYSQLIKGFHDLVGSQLVQEQIEGIQKKKPKATYKFIITHLRNTLLRG